MNKDIYTVRKLKNADGKRLNVKTKLEYAKEISENLKQHPEYLQELLEVLEIVEDDLYLYLSCDKKANITLYDQALLHLVKKREKGILQQK